MHDHDLLDTKISRSQYQPFFALLTARLISFDWDTIALSNIELNEKYVFFFQHIMGLLFAAHQSRKCKIRRYKSAKNIVLSTKIVNYSIAMNQKRKKIVAVN